MKSSTRGLEVGVGVVVGILLGTYFDHKFGTKPTGAIVGLLIGVIHAIKILYIMVREYHATPEESGQADVSENGSSTAKSG